MPRRRHRRGLYERLASHNDSMSPGTIGGRVSSAAPVLSASDVLAEQAGDIGVVAMSEGEAYYEDIFALASDGAQTVDLTYWPLDFSEDVKLNGLGQTRDVDWSRADQVISVDAAMDARTGDELKVQYAYRLGVPTAPAAEGPAVGDTWYGHNPGTNWNPFTFGDTLIATDLCLVATVGNGSTTPTGRGTWSKIVSTTTPNRTLDVWLGYNFDNTGTSITFAAGTLGGATAYRITTSNAQTSLPANSFAAGSSVFNPASVATASVTPAAGDVVFAFLGGDGSVGDISTRTDTGTALGSEIVNEVSGTSLGTAVAIASAAVVSSASWAINSPSDWWKAVIVKVTPA